jgi:hypothetical protein
MGQPGRRRFPRRPGAGGRGMEPNLLAVAPSLRPPTAQPTPELRRRAAKSRPACAQRATGPTAQGRPCAGSSTAESNAPRPAPPTQNASPKQGKSRARPASLRPQGDRTDEQQVHDAPRPADHAGGIIDLLVPPSPQPLRAPPRHPGLDPGSSFFALVSPRSAFGKARFQDSPVGTVFSTDIFLEAS